MSGSSQGGRRTRSATRPSERTRRADPARYAAYVLLRAVDDGAYANLELANILRRQRLTGRDAAFATELAFGTVRWQGLYDAVLAVAADRPAEAIDAGLRDVARLGIHQLLAMRVPAHAAADQTVGLARAVAGAGAAGFVNAVMRRVTERDRDAWLAQVVPDGGGADALAVRFSHPAWTVKALHAALVADEAATRNGVETELAALLEANNTPAAVSLVARPGLTTVADLVARGAEPSALSPLGARLPSGRPGDIPEIRDGRAAVQDEGSQLVALAVGAAPISTSEAGPRRWLDLCSGPGGKAGVLAGLAAEACADLVCTEVSTHRADLVRGTLRLAIEAADQRGSRVDVRNQDGRSVGQAEPAAYERVLVDAPCTGLGALRRRPEARWRRTPRDLATLGPLQRDLLRSALDATAPGGVVVYATCSPHLAETRFVVADVTKGRSDVDVIDARPVIEQVSGGAVRRLGPGPFVQLWPHIHDTDAMFLALLRRKG